MGIELKRIEKEFILKSILDEEIPLEILLQKKRFRAKLYKVEESFNKMYIFVEDNPVITVPIGDVISVYFKFHGTLMTFSVVYLGIEGDCVVTNLPAGVYRDLEREFERVRHPENIGLSFSLKGEKFVLNFPTINKENVTSPPVVSSSFDSTTISALITDFRNKIKDLSSESKIVMFKERKPETTEEKIIVNTGKMLLFPQSYIYNSFKMERLYPRISPISADSLMLYFKEQGMDMQASKNKIRAMIEEKKNKAISRELYAPVIFYQYVVAYVYLVSGKDKRYEYDRTILDYVHEFCMSFAYSLKIHGYFKPQKVKNTYNDSEIIDISLTGVLFSVPLSLSEDNFVLFTDMEICLNIEGKDIPVMGRIVRKSKDADRLYVAVSFLDLKPDDRLFLARSIYGQDFMGEF
ncbi:PilZ domain-containing protein [Spirochaetia bacterium 38H-sp]|uniref:PilZ domain-containing protein n=1 Tax=Rarispira pelagica TaxID=3141764 RepID=A0ABU9UC11_9SPIR